MTQVNKIQCLVVAVLWSAFVRRKIVGNGPLVSANGVTHVAYLEKKAGVNSTSVKCMVANLTTSEYIKCVVNVSKTF